jgi:RNA recognition motif-containing protein
MSEADAVAQAIIVSEEPETKQNPNDEKHNPTDKTEVRSSTPNEITHDTNKSSTETTDQTSKLNSDPADESPKNIQSSAQSSTKNSSPISVQDFDKNSDQNSTQNSTQNSAQNTAQNCETADLVAPENDENTTEPVSAKNETQNETQRHSSVKQRNSNDRKLFVGALGWTTTDKHLFEYFKEYGEVEDVECKIDQQTNRCRGFGFVLFKEQSSVDAVLSENEHKINGKKVDPKYAVEQKRDGKVFVGGLRSETTDEAVKSYFETFGPVENIERPYDKHQGKAKGFAFITFTEDNIISKVVVEKYHDIEGKRCEVKEAVPSELNTGYETNNFRNE